MAAVFVSYYLPDPSKRPNPWHMRPQIVFRDGVWNAMLDDAKVPKVDILMARYGISRAVPDWAKHDGSSEVHDDGPDSDGPEDHESEVLSEGPTSEEKAGEGPEDAEGDARDEGRTPAETDSEGPETDGDAVEPVKRRTKDEKEAGLTNEQAALFRASDHDDPEAWLASQAEEDPDDFA